MSREAPVRICERVRVKFPRSTRPVICCQCDSDAKRIRDALGKRLEKYKLQLNEEKTKLVSFNKKQATLGKEQGTFDFLGFTFYLGKSRAGRIIPKLRTRAKSFRIKLNRVTEWAKQIRNKIQLQEIWKLFCMKMRGHIQFYGVTFNIEKVRDFLYEGTRIVFKWLNKRSQRKSFSWEKFNLFIKKNPLLKTQIMHRLF
jgi:RNA-directed DNA polymerase